LHPPPGLEGFCESNKERLVGILTLHCGDPHTAEELAQETLVKVCIRWRSVERMMNPEAWMFRVAINLANSHFRRKAAERKAKTRLKADSYHRDPDIADVVAVRQALADLPKRQRSVLVLRFYADLSVRDVAEALDMPEGTVKTLTHRGMNSLRTNMNLADLREVPNVG
jgi:RNA polymerase sigma-70 factor (sigma-E family)